MRKTIIAAFIMSFASAAAQAQTQDSMLRAVTQMELAIEPFDQDPDAIACNLRESVVEDEIKITLAALAKFRVVSNSNIYLNPVLTVMRPQPDLCVFYAKIGVYSVEDVRISQSRRTVPALVELWKDGTLSYAAPANAEGRLKATMRGMLQSLVEDWAADNR